MDAAEFIANRLEDQIDWYDKKSAWNQKCFKRLQVYQIVAAAMIPVLTSGYFSGGMQYIQLLVALLGASIAIVTGVIGLFKFQENWLAYRTTCETLRHEKFLYLTHSEPYNCDDSFHLLVSRVESVISKENSSWSQYMRKAIKGKESDRPGNETS